MRLNDFYKKAGARIKEQRSKNGYTREYLAELADISPKFLYEIETGKKGFSAETLVKLATSLSVSCEYLLDSKAGETCNNGVEEMNNLLRDYDKYQLPYLMDILKLINKINAHGSH